jgi:hypothetical protein
MHRPAAHILPKDYVLFGAKGLGHRGWEQTQRFLRVETMVLEGVCPDCGMVHLLQGLPYVSCVSPVV